MLYVGYLSQQDVINKLLSNDLEQESMKVFLEAYKNVPELAEDHELLRMFCRYYIDKETVVTYKEINSSYSKHQNKIFSILRLVGEGDISKKRALELPIIASDILNNDFFFLASDFSKIYLKTNEDCEFFRKMLEKYKYGFDDIQFNDFRKASESISNNQLSREMAILFPEQASVFLDKKMKETRYFIFDNAGILIKDVSDLRFLTRIVGEYGNYSDKLIRNYKECLDANVITTADKELVLEFTQQFRVISPNTLNGYKEAKKAGHEKVYIAQLIALAEKMTGSGIITEEERSGPYYKDLLKHVYSDNSGKWSSYESNESCLDRSGDLAEFKIQPRYEIDLLSQSEIRVKEGEILDVKVMEEVQKPILDIAEKMKALGHDKVKIIKDLNDSIDRSLEKILQKGGLQGVDIQTINTTEEKLLLVLTDYLYGTRAVDQSAIKNIFITYEFATFEDVSDYIAGTMDRVGRASNQDYALFCEVGTFYSDRIKEVNRRLVQNTWNNPAIALLMPEYFKKLAQNSIELQQSDMLNRLQLEKLGISKSFLNQARKILEKRDGKKYSDDQIKKIIHRYENITEGLSDRNTTSSISETKTFYGLLRSQKEKTLEALKLLTGQAVDPKKIHLGEIDLQQALTTEANIREGKYDEEQFASYTAQRLIDIFEDERIKINDELSKFESLSGKKREVLYAYITKTKESANARMVGGVCVSGDNPKTYPKNNMWDIPNYFQMVFQEPDTLQSQGLVLLHHFNENGKKILTASFNPSSTYLYSVDESALFNGITNTLEVFAKENGFDAIVVSRNKTIRTNRTNGEFEKAMDKRISEINKSFEFDSAKQFSFNPNYTIKETDVIWEKEN